MVWLFAIDYHLILSFYDSLGDDSIDSDSADADTPPSPEDDQDEYFQIGKFRNFMLTRTLSQFQLELFMIRYQHTIPPLVTQIFNANLPDTI